MVAAFICFPVMSPAILYMLWEQKMALIIPSDLHAEVIFNYYKLPLQLKRTGVKNLAGERKERENLSWSV